jgi:3-oxoacyl-[acyl-carrier protein] reductase
MAELKQILITGAGKGIGYELTLKALKEGHIVYALSRNVNALIPHKLTYGDNLIVLPFDLSKSESYKILSEQIVVSTSSLDIIINNAGLLINKSFLDLQETDWNILWDVNVMGPVRLIKALISFISTSTHIVNISSMGGFQGSLKFPGLSAYSTVKGALSILTECLSIEAALNNCSVNALCLGAVQTEMLEQAFPGYQAPVKANEMADYILNFAINNGRFMSGKIIPVSISNPN